MIAEKIFTPKNFPIYGMQICSWESSRECSCGPRADYNVSRVWWRYIDDIFAIWTHGVPSLRVFIKNLNRHHPTIKFTAFWSAKEVTFLNTRVYMYIRDGLIGTDLHVKPTDTHQYLRIHNCHPHHCKTSIPYSQALCLCRI